MFEELLASVSNFILNIIESWGYAGVLVLMTLESANVPIPSEIIMPFSGFLASTGQFNFWLVVLVGALGNLIGSMINYFIAYRYGRASEKFLAKLAFIGMEDFEVAE